MRLFKQDLSADQISGRLGALYPEPLEKQASPSTIYTCLYRETAKDPVLKEHFRQNRAIGRGQKTVAARYVAVSPSLNARKPLKRSPVRVIGRGIL
ncbi:MAG: hypothetical protein LBB98_14910 [Treponema sp.]|nr:hypothetical protein [Treponema sp.]